MIEYVLDVTDRKLAESILRESEERFKSAFENAPIGMALLSLEGEWLRVNPSLCDITGYSEDKMLGMGIREIVHSDDIKRDISSLKKLRSGDIKTYRREERYIHKKGHT